MNGWMSNIGTINFTSFSATWMIQMLNIKDWTNPILTDIFIEIQLGMHKMVYCNWTQTINKKTKKIHFFYFLSLLYCSSIWYYIHFMLIHCLILCIIVGYYHSWLQKEICVNNQLGIILRYPFNWLVVKSEYKYNWL